MKLALTIAAIIFLATTSQVLAQSQESASPARINLHDDWALQSSCKVSAPGDKISAPNFPVAGWHYAIVPSTVVAALVADKTYPDPYFGDNLAKFPGMNYRQNKMFSLQSMPKDSPFRCSWWYRKEFTVPTIVPGQHIWLDFAGINNRANIWLNGKKIADSKQIAGAYRTYEFDITSQLASAGTPNVLAVETIAQTEKDLGINWVDWNPTPPDKDMGLWRPVSLRVTGPVEIRSPMVATHFPGKPADEADLTVVAELHNASAQAVTGTLEADLENQKLAQTITLAPGETRTVLFTPENFPQLHVQDPELWWPAKMGVAFLHNLSVWFFAGTQESDHAAIRYGIREITSDIDPQSHRLFRVNGKRILIRGGGWAPDMLLRENPERLKTQLDYVQDLNLNTIRLEGPMESDEFFDLADKNGILVMAGWTCCDYWQKWTDWKQSDIEIATASLRSEIESLRAHPSLLVWLNGSDQPPPAAVERPFLAALKDLDWPNPILSSASENITPLTGASGVKMRGPYDYTPPDFWLADKSRSGGAYGFATEIGSGAAIPLQSSLEKMLPADHIKPDDPMWNFHAGEERFSNLQHFDDAMKAIYGRPRDFDDYERKAQAMAYDSERAMFEAYSRNKYQSSTGVIQWMLNNAWPSLIWHLWDYYLQPGGGYYGVKKACESDHVMYSYDDRSVVVVNNGYYPALNYTVTAKLLDAQSHERFSVTVPVDVPADGVVKAGAFPERAFLPESPLYFVDLTLKDQSGKVISTNFYWLPAKKNVYDWSAEDNDAFTPVKSYEDLTALNSIPSVGKLDVTSALMEAGGTPYLANVIIRNPSDRVALFVGLEFRAKNPERVLSGVVWDDNYFSLMPGEVRIIRGHFPPYPETPQFLPPMDNPELFVTGWNIESSTATRSRGFSASNLGNSQ
jgi:exo-1,4-beta-D-glucosaminidase